MTTMLFVNLPVENLEKSVAFFTDLGFSFDPVFTDENATAMVVGPNAFVMLLVKPFFQSFTSKEIADAHTHTETIVTVSAETRDAVDTMADQAMASGGSPVGEPVTMDGMYQRSFADLDGHHWEVMWMDPEAMAS